MLPDNLRWTKRCKNTLSTEIPDKYNKKVHVSPEFEKRASNV